MDDTIHGTRDKRGDWKPNGRLDIAPFWSWPLDPSRLGRWLVDYVWLWNAFHMVTALLYWALVVPDVSTLETLSWGWALRLYAVNAIGIFVMYGAVELFFYVKHHQATRFKFNGKFPSDNPSDVFWFKSQNIDDFLRSFFVSIPLWTLVEVLTLWAFANGWGTWLSWEEHWPWLAVMLFLVPAIHEVHVFCIHRLIHTPRLYKWIHSVHHHSINPFPWSSLSMHPVESFLYFAEMFWHLVLPSNPVVALFQLHGAGFGATNGHIGLDKLELGDEKALDSHAYAHYLHHKHFEVNYGADGIASLDQWFGTWHDGTLEGDRPMKERFKQKRAREREVACDAVDAIATTSSTEASHRARYRSPHRGPSAGRTIGRSNVTVRIAIIGAGIMGEDHARIVAEDLSGVVLQVVCDASAARAREVADRFGAGDVSSDPEACIARSDVDAVLIASPDQTHAPLALAAIAAAKPVLCEKPLAPSSADCRSVIDAEVKAGHQFVQVGFMRRFDPSYAEMKAALADGALGRAIMMHNFHRNVAAPASFTGPMAITNSAPHEFDAARFVLDTDYRAITVFRPASADGSGTGAPVFMVLETSDGQLVNIEINNNAGYGYDVRGELVAEKGSVFLNAPIWSRTNAALAAVERYAPDWRPRFAEAYRLQNKAFVTFVATGVPSSIASNAWDGLCASLVAEKGVEALASGRRTAVELPDKPTLYRKSGRTS